MVVADDKEGWFRVLNNLTQGQQVQAGQQVKIAVRDTGAGIAKKHLSKTFEPFSPTNDAVGPPVSRRWWLTAVRVANHGLSDVPGCAT